MELNLVDYDSDTMIKRKSSSLHIALVLVGLLLAFNLAQSSEESVRIRAQECITTLGVKFINFCIAKSVQFRYIAPLQAQASFMSLVFWFTLTRSVSSLYS